MRTFFTYIKIILLTLVVFIGVGLFVFLIPWPQKPADQSIPIGLTFSIHAANSLNIDPVESFQAMVNELKPKLIRIPVYWDLIEAEQGVFDFRLFDQQLAYLADKDIQVILVIGHKQPRWPECHLPSWVRSTQDVDQVDAAMLTMLNRVVDHYKDSPNLYAWQVENEALFAFGDCPDWSNRRAQLKREIELVRLLDPIHPITTSESGELGLWSRTASLPIDWLSISMYRDVYNEYLGRTTWRVNTLFYKFRALLVRPFVEKTIISELQLEPWAITDIKDITDEELTILLPANTLSQRMEFARLTEPDVILGWGIEWWYYRKTVRNDDSYWQAAKDIFSGSI